MKLITNLFLLFAGSIFLLNCSKKDISVKVPDPINPKGNGLSIDTLGPGAPMKHVGGLHTASDFARIKTKLNENAQPWLSGYNKLLANSHAQLTYTPNPPEKLIRGGRSTEEPEPDNYSRAFNDVAAAYQLALRWKISGEDTYAQKSIQILNAWASICKRISGDSNAQLAAGIYGYQFALTGELMRDYSNWQAADFKAYQKLWRLAGVDQLHVNGIQNKFWESDDSVVNSIEACLTKMFAHKTVMPVASSGQWGGQAFETWGRTNTVDLLYMAGGGIVAHPMGPAAGVTALRQAWKGAVDGLSLEDAAKTYPEFAKSVEKFSPLNPPKGDFENPKHK